MKSRTIALLIGLVSVATPQDSKQDKVTEDQAGKLARAIDAAFAKGDPSAFDDAVDKKAMLRLTKGSAKLSARMSDLIGDVFDDYVLGGQMLLDQKGQYKLLRIKVVDGSPRPLFRHLQGDRVDYHELVLENDSDGKTRIVDIFMLAPGELRTASLRAWLIPGDEDLKVLNQMKVPTPGDLVPRGDIAELLHCVQQTNYREAVNFYQKKSETLKTNMRAHRIRISAAQHLGAEEFQKAIDDVEKAFPKDPYLYFLRVSGAIAAKKYDRAIDAIDAIDGVVGGDPYCNVWRATIHVEAKNLAKARECAEKATKEEPTLDRGWWALTLVCIQQKDFASTAKVLTASEKALNYKLGDLSQVPAYAEFVKSDEYKEWIKSHK